MFVEFAEQNKNSCRDYIAKTILSRKELNDLIEIDRMQYSDSEIQNNPSLIRNAITCELYKRSFFKI